MRDWTRVGSCLGGFDVPRKGRRIDEEIFDPLCDQQGCQGEIGPRWNLGPTRPVANDATVSKSKHDELRAV